jgi:hypothetical protein
MRTSLAASLAVASFVGLNLPSPAHAEGQFHFPVGISYASGIQKVTDKLYDFYTADGYEVDKIVIPVGLVLNPYYEWETSFGGVGAGVSVGPTSFVLVDEVTFGGGTSTDNVHFSYAVPVGAFVRYTPWPKATASPYVKVGFKYPFAGGDNLEASQTGVAAAVGVEFWRTKAVGMSFEVGYDSSQLKVKYTGPISGISYSDKVTSPGFTAALSVVF